MGQTTNFLWDYGTKGQTTWWDTWSAIFQSIDTDLHEKTGGYIDSREYATLELADAAAYGAGKMLVISQNHTLTANTVLTASVMRIPGGSFTKASTYTLHFSGKFINSDNGQAFIGFDPGDVTGL